MAALPAWPPSAVLGGLRPHPPPPVCTHLGCVRGAVDEPNVLKKKKGGFLCLMVMKSQLGCFLSLGRDREQLSNGGRLLKKCRHDSQPKCQPAPPPGPKTSEAWDKGEEGSLGRSKGTRWRDLCMGVAAPRE